VDDIPRIVPKDQIPAAPTSSARKSEHHHPYAFESPRGSSQHPDDPETASMLAMLPYGINPSTVVSGAASGETAGTPTMESGGDPEQSTAHQAALAMSSIGMAASNNVAAFSASVSQTLFASMSALHQTMHESFHTTAQSRKDVEDVRAMLKDLIEKVDLLSSKVDLLTDTISSSALVVDEASNTA
jgi:hypothetical protein